jgi:hypothetical protein
MSSVLTKLKAEFENQNEGKDILNFHDSSWFDSFLYGGGWICVTSIKLKMMNWIIYQGGWVWGNSSMIPLNNLQSHTVVWKRIVAYAWVCCLQVYVSLTCLCLFVCCLFIVFPLSCFQGKFLQCLFVVFSLSFVFCVLKVNIFTIYLLCLLSIVSSTLLCF